MQSKEKRTKPDVPKIHVPSEVVAYVVGCSQSYVKMIRRGIRRTKSRTGQRIEIAETLFAEGTSTLISEIKKILKPLE